VNRWIDRIPVFAVCLLFFLGIPEVPTFAASEIEALTGAHTRVVWLQDQGDGTDSLGRGNQLMVMGLDSRDKKGERSLLSSVAGYRKPLLTPDGKRVVFSLQRPEMIFVVHWDGGLPTALTKGMAVAVWAEPKTGTTWVYAVRKPDPQDEDRFSEIVRFPIDRPELEELVWNKTAVNKDNFQLSRDGNTACSTLPWPSIGRMALPNRSFQVYAKGCWPSMAPDDSRLAWVFDGSHRNLTMFPADGGEPWRVAIDRAKGIDGFEVYHPRWTNHPGYLVITGPYKIAAGPNAIRGGGAGVEVYLGKFSADMTAVTDWVQVSHNQKADFFPDAWIAGGERASLRSEIGPGKGPNAGKPLPPKSVTMEGALLEMSDIPDPSAILPYRNAFVVYRYRVTSSDAAGASALQVGKEILVAHWVIRDGKKLFGYPRSLGRTYRMTIEDMALHPEWESERLIRDMDAWDLPLYVDVSG